jgi:hypothetical protein
MCIFIRNVPELNVTTEWLPLLPRIQKVPGWNLGPDTGYPDWSFLWFSSVSRGIYRCSASNVGHDRPIHYLLFILSFDRFSSVLLTASLSKLYMNVQLTWNPLHFLLVVHVTTLLQILGLHGIEWDGDKFIMNLKWFGRKRSWPNFKLLSQHSPGGSKENDETRQSG